MLFLLLSKFPRTAFRLALAAGAALALSAAAACAPNSGPAGNDADDLALAWEAWAAIHANYAAPDTLPPASLAGGAIARIMNAGELDPYPFLTDLGRMRGQIPASVPEGMADVWRATRAYRQTNPAAEPAAVARMVIQGMIDGLPGAAGAYLTPEQFPEAQQRLTQSIEGSYLGIGARVVAQEGQIRLFPFDDSPAEKAGIEPGDVLLAVNGVPINGATPAEVGEQVKGPEGTKARLRLERAGEPAPLELDVFRGSVELDTVASQLVPGGIGYLRIFRFRENTGRQVLEALEQLNRFDLLALILDLRLNSGGSPAAAAETAAQFLPPGAPFRYLDAAAGARQEHPVPETETRLSLDDLPMAVLVDEQTVGAAEALAAALQHANRATLVGAPTYGDGHEYDFITLSDGSALYLPTARWYTRNGQWLGESPVQPDLLVEFGETPTGPGGEKQFNAAYELLDQQLPPFR